MKVHHLPLYLFLLIIQYFAGYSYANDANYYACNNGYSNCNQSLLTEQQKQTVQQSSLSRNYYACNNGYSNCNYSLLSDEQKQTVQQSLLSRNYYACNNGYSNCNQSLLTEQQKQTVQQSSLSRNYYACNNGYSNCNYSLLSDEQKQGIQQKIANSTNPTASGGLACAENGSCYGDISNITGLPKTTHVNGYFRRDGTYVRGHYRSRR